MSNTGIDAPQAHSLRPPQGRPHAASHPQIQINYLYDRHVFTPCAIPASPPTPGSHSP
jgi:hypothetical protein